MTNVVIYENLDALLVYSALEQFTDSPVVQRIFPDAAEILNAAEEAAKEAAKTMEERVAEDLVYTWFIDSWIEYFPKAPNGPDMMRLRRQAFIYPEVKMIWEILEPRPIIFFSMGRLYLFTIFSALLFILIYIIFCFKMYILVPNMYQMFFESIYNFVFNIVSEQAGILAIVHFPLVFSIFNVILYGNLVGLVPFSFTVTSHLTFTFSLGLFVFIGIVLLTILNKRIGFFRLFIPTGVPKLLVPLLCVIEVISYVFRVVSLSVRLFANMMAGHALLHILLGFVPVIFNFKNVVRFLFVFPIAIIMMITLLEIGISLLQSYVFIVLISIYLRDCYGGSAH